MTSHAALRGSLALTLLLGGCSPDGLDIAFIGKILPCPDAGSTMSEYVEMYPTTLPPEDLLREIERFADITLRFSDPAAAGLSEDTFALSAEGWDFAELLECGSPTVRAKAASVSAPEGGSVDWSGAGVPKPDVSGYTTGYLSRLLVTTSGTATHADAAWEGMAPEDGPLIAAGAYPGEPLSLNVELRATPSGFEGTWTVLMSEGDPGELDVIGREVTSGTVTSVDPGP